MIQVFDGDGVDRVVPEGGFIVFKLCTGWGDMDDYIEYLAMDETHPSWTMQRKEATRMTHEFAARMIASFDYFDKLGIEPAIKP